jgi:hypothetical protein
MRRLVVLLFFAALAQVANGFTPGTDHSLMNASSGPIVLDIRSSHGKPITHFRLVPGYSVGFDGVFTYLRVRFATGKTLTLPQQQLTQLHSGATPAEGAWVVENSGVRCVSHRDYMLAYRRFHKLWP